MASGDLVRAHAFESKLVNVDLTNVSAPKRNNKLLYITLWLVLKNNGVGTSQHQTSSGINEQCRSVYIYRRRLRVEDFVTRNIGDRIWKAIL